MSETKRVQLSFAQSFQVCSSLQAFYAEAVAAGWGYRKVLREIRDRTQIAITINQLRTVFEATGLDSAPLANKDRINNPNRKPHLLKTKRLEELENQVNFDRSAMEELAQKHNRLCKVFDDLLHRVEQLEAENAKLKNELGVS